MAKQVLSTLRDLVVVYFVVLLRELRRSATVELQYDTALCSNILPGNFLLDQSCYN